MTAPVLFLDIDGVLNSKASWDRLCSPRLDPDAIALLNEVVARTGCAVVVSSTWRLGRSPCRGQLRRAGLRARFHADWRTPYLPGGDRGQEIADWLGRNPGIERWATVDDDGDMLPGQRECFAQTTFQDGLTRAHADRLVAILTGAPDLTRSAASP